MSMTATSNSSQSECAKMQLFADLSRGSAGVFRQPGTGTCQTNNKGLAVITRMWAHIDALISNKNRMRFGLGVASP
jgi:hypothetical protein